jgi:folate-binding protein YgfZ
VTFLNGLVSNDVAQAAHGRAVWAALLSPQGRYAADFFIFYDDERLLLEASRAAVAAIVSKLSRYKLRSAVALADVSDELAVYAVWDGAPPRVALTAPDPRLREAGFRLLSPEVLAANTDAAAYAAHRLRLGLPDGPPDLEPDKTLLLEAGFDELNGVDWKKGCYMGQELTARTKYRGLVKRRLVPLALNAPAPAPGTAIMANGLEVGTLRSSADGMALAMLRVDALEMPLSVDGIPVTPKLPGWLVLNV